MSKVILRKLAISDVDDLLTINLNPDVTKYIPFMIRDRNVLLSWINSLSPTDHEFMILRSSDPSNNGCVDDHYSSVAALKTSLFDLAPFLPGRTHWRSPASYKTVSGFLYRLASSHKSVQPQALRMVLHHLR